VWHTPFCAASHDVGAESGADDESGTGVDSAVYICGSQDGTCADGEVWVACQGRDGIECGRRPQRDLGYGEAGV
jgi:hypothetical protein